jgi:CRP-like cAMP-binding protein
MAEDAYHELLAHVPLFEGLDHHDLEYIGKVATLLDIKAGQVLMNEGTLAHEMVIILDGTIEITREGEHIADLGPGSFAGEIALLTRSHRNSTVRAKTDVRVLHIDGRAFASVLDEAPRIAVRMLPTVAARVTANSESHTD